MTNRAVLYLTSAFAAASLATWTPAAAAGIAAGSLIQNTASATFLSNSTTQTVGSNTVTVTVDEVLDVTAVSQESAPVPADTSAVLRFKVTNTGNGPESFTLTANPDIAGNDFNATVTGLAIDVNGNGVFDPGVDTELVNGGQSPTLAPDASADILVLVSTPTSAAVGSTSKVELTAAATTGTGTPGTVLPGTTPGAPESVIGATGGDATAQASLVIDRSEVALLKSAVVSDPFGGSRPVPSAIITYTIAASVTGSGSVAGLAVTDVIPDGTSYQAGTLTLDGAALSDPADGDAGQASASGVAVQLGTVAAGSQRTVTFQVKIN